MNTFRSALLNAAIFAAPVAAFWGIYYLITGSVPAVSVIEFTETQTVTLPFPVSRWWDVAGIAVILATFIPSNFTMRNREETCTIIIFAVASFLVGIASQAVHSLYLAAGAGAFAGAIVGMITGQNLQRPSWRKNPSQREDIEMTTIFSLSVLGGLLLSAGLANMVAVLPLFLVIGLISLGISWRIGK